MTKHKYGDHLCTFIFSHCVLFYLVDVLSPNRPIKELGQIFLKIVYIKNYLKRKFTKSFPSLFVSFQSFFYLTNTSLMLSVTL